MLKNKQGASYVLSVIIITMIMFAVGGSLYYWSNSLQLEQQGTAEQSQERLFDTLGACISVTSIDYDTLTNTSDVIFRNCGHSKLEVGDDKIRDIGVLQAPNIDPCSFNLNGSTCVGCPFTLGPGSSRLIVLNWSREAPCAERVTKGVKHQVVFYIDRLSTTSGIFTAEDIVTANTRASTSTNPGSSGATCSVSLTNNSAIVPTDFAFLPGVTVSFCFNFTVTNTGSQIDSFALFNDTTSDSSGSCAGAFMVNELTAPNLNHCNRLSTLFAASAVLTDTRITLDPGETAIILVNITNSAPVAAGFCSGGLNVISNNCNSQSSASNNFTIKVV